MCDSDGPADGGEHGDLVTVYVDHIFVLTRFFFCDFSSNTYSLRVWNICRQERRSEFEQKKLNELIVEERSIDEIDSPKSECAILSKYLPANRHLGGGGGLFKWQHNGPKHDAPTRSHKCAIAYPMFPPVLPVR